MKKTKFKKGDRVIVTMPTTSHRVGQVLTLSGEARRRMWFVEGYKDTSISVDRISHVDDELYFYELRENIVYTIEGNDTTNYRVIQGDLEYYDRESGRWYESGSTMLNGVVFKVSLDSSRIRESQLKARLQ